MSDSSPFFAPDIDPPYFATVFTWTSSARRAAHETFAAEVFQEAAKVPGFIGVERSSNRSERNGIAVTYWETRAGLTTWMDRVRPMVRRVSAPDDTARLYDDYVMRVVQVEHATRHGQGGSVPA